MFDELLDPSILNEFILESKEHLESVENSLIALEREADDINSVNILFRALHSIKGGASFLGLKKVTKITHELEDLLDSIRRGKTVLTPSIADTLLEAKDVLILIFDEILASLESQTGKSLQLECLESGIDISSLVSTIEVVKNETQPSLTGKTQCGVAGKTITQKHDDTAAKESSGAPDAFPHNNDAEADQESKNIFCDSLKTHLDKIQNAITNTGNAIFEKNTFHTIGKIFGEIKHAADYLDFYIIKEFSERCEYYCKIAENKDKFDSVEFKSLVIKSLEFFLDCIANIQQSGMEKEPDTCLLADMLIAVQYAEKLPDVSSECFAENQSEEFEPIKTNENNSDSNTVIRDKKQFSVSEKTIRVEMAKLDALINLVGEFIIAKNTVSSLKKQLKHSSHEIFHELHTVSGMMEHLTDELQRTVMAIRMVPVSILFNKMGRVIRDMTKENGKEIHFVTMDNDTELDKNVIELINDPLVHIIRNAGDHGIESPEERLRAGKTRYGTISLGATYNGDSVIITIDDDGKGIDPVKLKTKALTNGIISQTEFDLMTEEQAIDLIFAPGLSTADTVSSISGRGVGMDVVRTNIQRLGGIINVRTELLKGTTLSIKLPLTLAIVENILFKVKDYVLAFPLHAVIETVSVKPEEILYCNKNKSIKVRDAIIGVESVAHLLCLTEDDTFFESACDETEEGMPVIIVQIGIQKFGLAVDELLGKEQMIIKPLQGELSLVKGYAGTSILEDGKIVLILDPLDLLYGVSKEFSA